MTEVIWEVNIDKSSMATTTSYAVTTNKYMTTIDNS